MKIAYRTKTYPRLILGYLGSRTILVKVTPKTSPRRRSGKAVKMAIRVVAD